MRGRDEYLLLRDSINSVATAGSDITTVGRRPIHTVKYRAVDLGPLLEL